MIRIAILILTLLLCGCHKANIFQTQMEHLYGRYEFNHQNSIPKTRGIRDLQNSLIYYYTLWNEWPNHPNQLYNLINQQQTKTMDSLIVSLSEFQSLGIQNLDDTVFIEYTFKISENEIEKFEMTRHNDSAYQVIYNRNTELIYLRKKEYHKQKAINN
jgi:hypothetical protein